MMVGLLRPSRETETFRRLLFQLSDPLIDLRVVSSPTVPSEGLSRFFLPVVDHHTFVHLFDESFSDGTHRFIPYSAADFAVYPGATGSESQSPAICPSAAATQPP